MEKKVSYLDFDQALRELQEKFGERRIQISEIYEGFGAPIHLGVNWSAIGTVSAEEAVEFAGKLTAAAEAAANFKYNGYVITYGEG
jgi:hypothetical protein